MASLDDIARRHALPPAALDDLRRLLANEAATTLVHHGGPTASDTLVLTDPVGLARPTEAPLTAGERYEDLGLIGMGGMGEVRRVRDRQLNRVLAMKILRTELQTRPTTLARFVEEAQATAQLEHPNIIPVHDIGNMPDGRVFFTMKEVSGRTFTQVIDNLHAATSDATWGRTHDGWTLRRLVDALGRVCEAVAHAHARGVVHRDLKPDNIMVGDFGEVLVVDWGLAKIAGIEATSLGDTFDDETTFDEMTIPEHLDQGLRPVQTERANDARFQTRVGTIAGTPAFMAPEQARGETNRITPATDVYALGGMLYFLLSARPPHHGNSARDVVDNLIAGPPKPLRAPAAVPRDLIDIVDRAMAREPQDRFRTAGEVAEAITAWLEGAQKRARAQRLVQQAAQKLPEVARLRQRSEAHRRQAALLARELKPWDPVDQKRPAWELEDKANELDVWAETEHQEVVQTLQAALREAPDLHTAQVLLGQVYRESHEEAEKAGDHAEARRMELLLRAHDDGRHAAYLQGDGLLTLVTEPAGATVDLLRYDERDRRLVPTWLRTLGRTPLHKVTIPRGRWLLVISKPGFADVRYPVQIGRLEHWSGVAPGADTAHPIVLPELGSLGPDDVYVPAGWAWFGTDPDAASSLPRRRLWVDPFVLRRFPVTNAQFIAFLDDLVDEGREDEALRYVPQMRGSGALLYGRDTAGHFQLVPDSDGDVWEPDWPVLFASAHCAAAYGAWLAAREARPWRLPTEFEWEKAGRGVDGRHYPWGDFREPTWACCRGSREGRGLPASVDSFPVDESPYGVRGLAGNVSDFTSSPPSNGVPEDVSRAPSPERTLPIRVMARGGAWSYASGGLRLGHRGPQDAAYRMETHSFRLAHSWPVTDSD